MDEQKNTKKLPKVLTVDDKPKNLFALREILSELPLEIIEAGSGEEVLSLILRHRFFVVLLDVKMPGMDGIEMANLMQGYSKAIQTPVIFITGHDMDELEQLDGYAVGASDFIIKPVNPGILKSKVSMFLQLYLQSEELKNNYENTARLEEILKEKNLELEKNNASLEQISRARQHQYNQTQRLLEMNPNGMLVIDNIKNILFANPAAARLLNCDIKELPGEEFTFPIPNEGHTELIIDDENIVEIRGVHIDWSGEGAVLVSLQDITSLKQTEAKLYQLAQFDQLTGLANRRHCLEYLLKSLARARRRNGYLAVLFLDLDKFKDINDSRGHAEGDDLLKSVAKRLNACVREGDLAARFGGDEFVLILDEISQPEDAGFIAQKILDVMIEPHVINNKPAIIGCSIGIATFPLCGKETDDLFKSADIAMFHAKSQGRNNYQFFAKEMQQQLDERIHLEHDLRYAIKRNELSLHYQPQVDVNSGTIVAMEALLRWQHTNEGLISPAKFIPVAEKTGLIVEIGEWVMQTACHQVQDWQRQFCSDGHSKLQSLSVAVNVSMKQITNGDFINRLKHVIEETGFDPQYLELELTESLMMDDPEATVAELQAIHHEGLDIAMDDFGTGYSSLSYLQRLPLTTLKIDQSFVAEIGNNTQSEVIIKTIIAMAHSLGLRVVAEGVETAQQLAFLRQNKCDLMQGYYFSRPLPYDQATLLLQDGLMDLCKSA
ncbi:MAG: EAL domain-containing protein [Spongiibacteraceae bacterium]|nr:EAL domain-containing protein [Spongiibacteraceae bacterium]